MHFKLVNSKVNYTLIKLLKDLGKVEIKYLHTKKIPRATGFTGKLCQTFKEEIITSQHKIFHDFGNWEHFPAHSVRAPLP